MVQGRPQSTWALLRICQPRGHTHTRHGTGLPEGDHAVDGVVIPGIEHPSTMAHAKHLFPGLRACLAVVSSATMIAKPPGGCGLYWTGRAINSRGVS